MLASEQSQGSNRQRFDRQRFGEIIVYYLAQRDLSLSDLARLLQVAPATTSRWAAGLTTPKQLEQLINLVRVLQIQDIETRRQLFRAAGFLYEENAAGDSPASSPHPEPHPAPVENIAEEIEHPPASMPANPGALLRDWLRELGRMARHPANMRGNSPALPRGWEGEALAWLQWGTAQVTPRHLLLCLLLVTLWSLHTRLLAPLLQWPVHDPTLPWRAVLDFGLALWLIPASVVLLLQFILPAESLLTRLFALSSEEKPTRYLLARYYFLQALAALIGYYCFVFLLVAAAWFCFHYTRHALPFWLQQGLLLLPLLFSYLTARTFPVARARSQAASSTLLAGLRVSPLDLILLIVFLGLGPLSALFLYTQQQLLQQPVFGWLLVLSLLGILLWEARQGETRRQERSSIRDSWLILYWGVLLPVALLWLPAVLPVGLGLPPAWQQLLLLTGHLVCQCLLISFLYVKGQAQLFWPLTLTLLLGEILSLLLLAARPDWGLMALMALTLLFLLLWWLGRQKASFVQHYLAIHPSFWVMQFLFLAAIAAWGMAGGGYSLLLLSVSTATLLWWANQPQISPATSV